MDEAKVPAGRVYTIADIARDPQYLARGMILRQPTYDGDDIAVPGIVPKLSLTPGALRERAPRLGEHTQQVLAALGLTEERQAELRAKRVIE